MITETVLVGSRLDPGDLEQWLHARAADEGAVASLSTSLRTVPGSRHWHLKRGSGSGTLEVTLDTRKSVVIFAVHDNRKGFWAGTAVNEWAGAFRLHLEALR